MAAGQEVRGIGVHDGSIRLSVFCLRTRIITPVCAAVQWRTTGGRQSDLLRPAGGRRAKSVGLPAPARPGSLSHRGNSCQRATGWLRRNGSFADRRDLQDPMSRPKRAAPDRTASAGAFSFRAAASGEPEGPAKPKSRNVVIRSLPSYQAAARNGYQSPDYQERGQKLRLPGGGRSNMVRHRRPTKGRRARLIRAFLSFQSFFHRQRSCTPTNQLYIDRRMVAAAASGPHPSRRHPPPGGSHRQVRPWAERRRTDRALGPPYEKGPSRNLKKGSRGLRALE